MVKSCCCGVPLKKGTIIIGILSAIGSALICLVWIIAMILLAVVMSQINIDSGVLNTIYIISMVSYGFGILVAVGQFSMAIVLVRGARQEDPRKVKLYLIYGTVMIILSLISTVVSAVGVAGFAIYVVVSFVLQAYFLVVIWSYYKELKAKEANAQGVVYAPPQPAPGYGQPSHGYPQPAPGYEQPSHGYPQPAPAYEKPSPLGPNSNADFVKA